MLWPKPIIEIEAFGLPLTRGEFDESEYVPQSLQCHFQSEIRTHSIELARGDWHDMERDWHDMEGDWHGTDSPGLASGPAGLLHTNRAPPKPPQYQCKAKLN